MENIIKQKLIERGFEEKTLLNNRGLIGACIEETKEQLIIPVVSKRYIVAKEQEGIFKQLCCCVYDDLNKAQDFADAMADTIEHWDSKIVILNVC